MLQRQLTLVPSEPTPSHEPSIDVAFATSDLHLVDQHFGSTLSLARYRVTPTRADLMTVSRFEDVKKTGRDDKLRDKLRWLRDCDVVFCEAIGTSAIAQLNAQGTQPVRVTSGTSIGEALRRVQGDLARSAPWLRKYLVGPAGSRGEQRTTSSKAHIAELEAMTAEEWNE